MAVLLYALHPKPSKRLLWAVLLHDVPERFTGDIPTTIKWTSSEIKVAFEKAEAMMNKDLKFNSQFQADEENWLKALDLLELYIFCMDEIASGNQHIIQVRDDCWNILARHKDVPREVKQWIKDNPKWKRENNRWEKLSSEE